MGAEPTDNPDIKSTRFLLHRRDIVFVMDESSDRLRKARMAAGFRSARSAAIRFGWIESTYASHENGQTPVPAKIAPTYAKAFGVSTGWLLTGEGQGPNDDPKSLERVRHERRGGRQIASDAVVELDIRAGASYAGGFSDHDVTYDDETRVYSREAVRAEWGIPPSYLREELGVTANKAEIVSIKGPSMDDGSVYALRPGDRVLVDRSDTDYKQGGLFAVWDGGSVIVKQVEAIRNTDPPRVICKSLNKGFDPFELVLDGNAHIIGRIAMKITRM